MNGARSIFMRKGYLLTALAAIVLLAASAGTAYAQVTVTRPAKVVEGEAATITVTGKASIPADTVATAVTLTVTATSEGDENDVSQNLGKVATLRFPANTNASGGEAITSTQTATLTVQTNHDPDAEDETIMLGYTLGGVGDLDNAVGGGALAEGDNPGTFTIDDDETQTYVFTVTTKDPEEATDIAATLKAVPAHVDGTATLTLHLDDPDYTLTATNPATINATSQTAAITIAPPDNDENRVEDSVTLTAHSGSVGNSKERASVTIKVADIHALPSVAMMVVDEDGDVLDPQPTSVPEGESVMVAVMPVDKDGDVIKAAEDLTVALTPTGTADAADYTLVGTFTIDADDDVSNAVEIEVRSDEDVGKESLMFDAVVSGDSDNGPGTRTSAAVLSLYIEDETAKKITPKASEADYEALMAAIAAAGGDDGVNPGDTVTLMTSDLFEVAPGYMASYGVSVEGDSASASASGEAVTINALMAGEAKITVTGTARMASSSLIPTQTVSNVAELTFPVMVVDTTLVVTLSAEPMEIAAGGTTMITATANRYVTAGDGAVEIALAVVGDGMLDPDSITIAMGDMSGSAMLTANESVTVVATGSGVEGLMQVAVTVTDGPAPEPVPALPLIAQWLLGLGLMGGGVRQLFRRRRQGS